jgi:chromodomain-helicase-DNA-binding protein 4
LEDLLIPENQNRISEESSACDTDSGLSKGCLNGVEGSCTEEALNNDVKVDKIHVYRRSATKCKGENVDSTRQDNKDSDSAAMNCKEQDESALSADDQQERKENVVAEENTDLRACDANEVSKVRERDEMKDTEENKEMDVSNSAENKVQAVSLAKSYEFLVKWVGKSNIHNSWISELQLKALAKRKLENYKARYGMAMINICEERWKQPQRVIALRVSKKWHT